MKYSVIVPAYNELESVRKLYGEIVEVMDGLDGPFEILFVDDGSFDGTVDELRGMASEDPRIRVLELRCNSGKSVAYMEAFMEAKGDIFITLDADLQDDPSEIPKMLKTLGEGNDLVVGRKLGRMGNEPSKTIPSRFFNGMLRLFFGIHLHDSNCGFRVMHRKVLSALELYGDLYRFIPQLAFIRGYKVAECGVEHRPRQYGQSKYGVRRFWTGMLDLLTVRFITGFAHKPLHFFGSLGLIPFLTGLGLEIYVLIMKYQGDLFRTHISALIIGAVSILVGIQLIATGLIGEMLTANRHREQLRQRRQRGDGD